MLFIYRKQEVSREELLPRGIPCRWHNERVRCNSQCRLQKKNCMWDWRFHQSEKSESLASSKDCSKVRMQSFAIGNVKFASVLLRGQTIQDFSTIRWDQMKTCITARYTINIRLICKTLPSIQVEQILACFILAIFCSRPKKSQLGSFLTLPVP